MARLTVDKIIKRIIMKVKRVDMDNDFMLEIINQCNSDITALIDIKELATVGTVTFTSGANEVSLPDDFQKNLSFAKNLTTGRNLIVVDDRRLIDRKIEKIDRTGNVFVIANDFPNIYYQHSPASDQTGKLYYHGTPTDLDFGDDFPSYIPSGLVFRLYYNYTLSQMYDIIEDGIEGEKPNTKHHQDQYDKALYDLEAFIGPDPDLPDNMSKNNPFFNFCDL